MCKIIIVNVYLPIKLFVIALKITSVPDYENSTRNVRWIWEETTNLVPNVEHFTKNVIHILPKTVNLRVLDVADHKTFVYFPEFMMADTMKQTKSSAPLFAMLKLLDSWNFVGLYDLNPKQERVNYLHWSTFGGGAILSLITIRTKMSRKG